MLWVSFTNEPSSCLPLLAGKISGCNFNPNVTARSRRFEERPRSLNSSLSYSGPWLRGQHNGHRSRGQGERRTQWSVGRLVGWSVGQGERTKQSGRLSGGKTDRSEHFKQTEAVKDHRTFLGCGPHGPWVLLLCRLPPRQWIVRVFRFWVGEGGAW